MVVTLLVCLFYFLFGRTSPQWGRASTFTSFLDHTQRRTTVGRTPLDEWSARRRDLYLTTHNTNNSQTPTPPAGFQPPFPASERPQTRALDRATTGTGVCVYYKYEITELVKNTSFSTFWRENVFYEGSVEQFITCFYGEGFLAPHPTYKLEYRPLSTVPHRLCYI